MMDVPQGSGQLPSFTLDELLGLEAADNSFSLPKPFTGDIIVIEDDVENCVSYSFKKGDLICIRSGEIFEDES